jgi:hypothetical protein
MPRACRRLLVAAPLAAALSLLTVASARDARGQEPVAPADPLAAARTLFADALRDENAGHFDVALDKFRRVRAVKDTAAIEYRIGSCLEGLRETAGAYGAYRASVTLGRGDASMADVVSAARTRIDALSHHVALLRLSLPDPTPRDLEVRIDGTRVPRDELVDPLALEPGTHVVSATSAESAPFRSEITLPEGGQATLTPTVAPARGSPSALADAGEEPALGAPGSPVDGRRTAGVIALAGGGGLLVGSLITLLLRDADVASLDRSCPSGQCPPGASVSGLESTRDRALAEGPVAAALAASGAVAAGVGLYLLLGGRTTTRTTGRAASSSAWMLLPSLRRGGAGADVSRAF